MTDNTTHPTLSLILDITNVVFKVAAIVVGAYWTWWNYRKSRTYAQKLELEIVGTVFTRADLYGDIKVTVRNIGATSHPVQHVGTFCELIVIYDDLTEESVALFRVFEHNHSIEPGETISDIKYWRRLQPLDRILWAKLTLRVVSGGVEWLSTCLVRVDNEPDTTASEVI